MSRTRKMLHLFAIAFLLPLALHALWWLAQDHADSWHTADWSSAGLLPAATGSPDAALYIWGAPTGRWKGVVSLHTWIVIKEKGARRYTRFDVAGWGRALKIDGWAPDARWYGNTPRPLAQFKGPAAEALIPRVRAAIARYPHGGHGAYRVWPGPNSNTFVAEVLAQIPEAGVVLPANAIGKDFRGEGLYVGASPTRTGFQISAFGLLGVTLGWREGLEVNILGLVAGLDPRRLAIKLPGWGTLALWPGALDPPGNAQAAGPPRPRS